jgi:hypothetical protein
MTRWDKGSAREEARLNRAAFRAEQEIKRRSKRRAAKERRDPVRDRLRHLEEKARRAVSRAKAREQRLYSYGQPIHPEERHRELLAAIKSERNRTLNAIRAEAQEISAEGRREVEILQGFPRDSVLGAVERSELGDRLTFARSDFERAAPQQIAARLAYLTQHGSKVERFAGWMAARERRDELKEKGQEGAHLAFAQEFEVLDRSLFEEAFNQRAATHAETVNTAEGLAKFCYTRMRDAESLAGAYSAGRYAIDEVIARQRYEAGGKVQMAVPGGHDAPSGEVAS